MQETDYNEIIKIIRSIINKKTQNQELKEELKSVGNEAYVLYNAKYDPNKGTKFTSFIYMKINSEVTKALLKIKREMKRTILIQNLDDFDIYFSPGLKKEGGKWIVKGLNNNHQTNNHKDIPLDILIKELSEDSKKIIKIVLKTNQNFNKKEIKKRLHKKLKLKYKIIDSLFKEIKEKINL